MNYYIAVLKKYAVFSGRATRAEYWYFVLFNIIAIVVLSVADIILTGVTEKNIGFLNIIYSLAVLIPSLAVAIRRLHDIGKSGWWLLVSLIPLIGSIWLLILMVTDSAAGDNQYGPNPKGMPAAPAAAPGTGQM